MWVFPKVGGGGHDERSLFEETYIPKEMSFFNNNLYKKNNIKQLCPPITKGLS